MTCAWFKIHCPTCNEELDFRANIASGKQLTERDQGALKALALAAHNKFAAHPKPKPEPGPVEDDECIHGMEFGCSICSGKDVRRPEPEGIKFSYRAKYEGQCPECDLPIAIGQRCVKTTLDRNLHADCLPES